MLCHNFLSKAAHNTPSHRLRLAEPPHALSRAANGVLHLSSGFALLGFRDRAPVCSGSSCFRRHPSQVINLSTDTIVRAAGTAASCLGLAVRVDLRGALPPKLSESRLTSRECQHASGRCSRMYPSRGLEEGRVLPELLLSLLSLVWWW